MRPKIPAPADGRRCSRPASAAARAKVTRLPTARPPRIAVLGAGGFIGSHLVPALALRSGARIVAVDVVFDKLQPGLPGVERVQASIRDPGLLDAITARADVVISLTALCNPALYNTHPIEVIDASYTDLVPLVKLCAERKRRLIHLSTCEVYGRRALCADGRPSRRMDEDGSALCLGPVHRERWTYATAKQLLERVIWAHGQHDGLEFTVVRPFNVIGPRMDFIPGVDGEGIPRVLAAFMHALLTGQDLVLVDGGRQRRSFLYVDEFVNGLLRIIERRKLCRGQIINLGNDKNDVSIRTLALAMVSTFRAQRPNAGAPRLRTQTAAAFYGEGYEDSIVRIPSMAKAARLLDWRPHMTLAQMLPPIVTDYLARYESRVARDPRALAVAPGLP
jgi:Nucleoside-diphosphate-sugar epimerases